MDVSALAALAAQRSVEALKASSHRHLAARARAMSPTKGPKASDRARGKTLLVVDTAARLNEQVSLAQALESIPTPLTTPPRIQSLQYTTLTAHSPPPSFSPAKRGDCMTPSNLSLWLGETLQGVRPEEACCAAPAAPASGPQAAEELSPVVTRRRLSGKRPSPLQESLLEASRCIASSFGPQAAAELKTPMPRRRLSRKGPAHRNPTPALLSQPCPAPSQLHPSAESQGLCGNCLPSSQTVVASEQEPSSIPVMNTGVQQQQQGEVINVGLHLVSTASELAKSTSLDKVSDEHDQQQQKQKQQRQPQQQRQRGQNWRSSRRKDQDNKLRLSRRAVSHRQMKKGAKQIIDLEGSPVDCSKQKVRPAKHARLPTEQQYWQRLPQPEPKLLQRAARSESPSHNCRMKRLKPLKLPVSCMGTRRRRTGHAEVSSVIGAVLACLHSAAPVPVVAVDITLAEDID